MVTGTAKGSSAGGRHGSHNTDKTDRAAQRNAQSGNPSKQDTRDAAASAPSGLQENTGDFRVGDKIIFSMRNGDILIRRSPQGEEITVAEATLAGLMVDAFFSDKFGNDYPTVTRQ